MTLRARCAAALLVLLALSPADARSAEGPEAVVGRLNATLLEAMRGAKALGFEGRYRLLEPVLREVFHFPEMARAVAGAHWAGFTGEQRGRFMEAFSQMSITTFASRFDGYSGERWEIRGQWTGLRGTVIVENEIIKASGKRVPVNYLFRRFGDAWRVVDIFLDAKYSELALRRAEYGSVLRREGFEVLLRRIEEKRAQRGGRRE